MNRRGLLLSALALLLLNVSALRSAEDERPKDMPVGMGRALPLVKLDERCITVRLPGTNATAGAERTLTIDPEKTRVLVGVITEQADNADGSVRVSMRYDPGKLADLKAGQRVQVMAVDDLATKITIVPMPQRKKRDPEKN